MVHEVRVERRGAWLTRDHEKFGRDPVPMTTKAKLHRGSPKLAGVRRAAIPSQLNC